MPTGERTIRRCTPDDAGRIAAIYDPIVARTAISFEDVPPGPAEMRRRIEAAGERFPWLACVRGERLLGYAYAAPHRARAAYRWSVDASAYVAEGERGAGVASALYERLFALLGALGYRRAYAGIALPNDASVALHRKAGFSDVGIYRSVGFKLGAWRDVLWLERSLGAATSEAPGEPRTLRELSAPSDGEFA